MSAPSIKESSGGWRLPATERGSTVPSANPTTREVGALQSWYAQIVAQTKPGRAKPGFKVLVVKSLKAGSGKWTFDLAEATHTADLDAAVARSDEAHRQALKAEGLSPGIIDVLDSWVTMRADARAVQLQLERASAGLDAAAGAAPFSERERPMAPLTAHELGAALAVTDDTIRQREREGELFSLLRVGRKRGREYPAFQAWPEFNTPLAEGEPTPLAQTLRALGAPRTEGADLYGFFSSRNDLLGDLTPVEVLVGGVTTQRDVDREVQDLLRESPRRRLEAVLSAASAYLSDLQA